MNLRRAVRQVLVDAGLWRPRNKRMPALSPADRIPPSQAGSRVTFDRSGTIAVDGQLFFPLGVYYVKDQLNDPSGAGLRAVREMGFNTVFFGGGFDDLDQLDRIHEAGLRVWYRPPGGLCQDFGALKTLAELAGRHPAMLFWELEDEPLLNRVSIADAAGGCDVIRAVDPYHPVLCTQWYSGTESLDALAEWFSLADVHAFTSYPVPLERWGTRTALLKRNWPHSIDVVARQTTMWRETTPKPIIPVLQAFAWNCLEDGIDGYPSPQAARFMAFAAIVSGANGLHYFGAPYPASPHFACGIPPGIRGSLESTHEDFVRARDMNAGFWRQQAGLIAELSRLSPLFLAPDDVESQVRVQGSESVRWRIKRHDGATSVIAVNASEAAGQIAVSSNGTDLFRNTLEPWDARVYSDLEAIR